MVGRRHSGNRGTYTGLSAIFQGVQFNGIGLFLVIVSLMISLRANGQEVFSQMVRRPGLPLVFLGTLVLIQAVITLAGSLEQKDGPDVLFNLLVRRLLPGSFLVVFGVAMLELGLFEMVMPSLFDSLGGGFLEMLYGLRSGSNIPGLQDVPLCGAPADASL